MFNIDKLQDTYTWKVEVKIPNNGTFEKIAVRVKYNRLPHNEKISLIEQMESTSKLELTQIPAAENDVFDRIFAGWEKGQIKDNNGEVEDTPENRAKLLNITEFRIALLQGFMQSMGGDLGKINS
ncbi:MULTISPECIES: hypothetical protein [Pasteurellaceae]|uniref:Phage protein n=1 Tax=Pasteurella atlantica TaxID=2827233 RepID=A0AAW8CLP5_9PAST|nr:hypothetical protein [Pasteurella atlantica]MBR0573684.1 hypothetical protein [Pasteurella atlantica]MDP8039683.1 hypothetical protein [Pasteurella atlantica]MDP8041774.1 hypothetical protein [Pasteurella atlantica]MDP8043952.1 hypothetical protein [Pasteurella atlantica]MDP8045930.1 hypothetical protein [Pasteurella atlantica]